MTGLEPAASGVTGRRSNQLSYTPGIKGFNRPVVTRFFGRTTPKMSSTQSLIKIVNAVTLYKHLIYLLGKAFTIKPEQTLEC